MENGIDAIDVFDLMKAGRFIRHQECPFLKHPDPSNIVVLFSHRWETLDHPDPSGIQFHAVVRFIMKACMMVSASTPNIFNQVDFSEIILCPNLYRHLFAEYEKLSTALETRDGLDALFRDEDLARKTELLLEYLLKTVGAENTLRVATDAALIAYLMRGFRIWYDYTSMPQEPRSRDEQRKFAYELSMLHEYLSQYYTAILWSKSSLKRAWCFLEGAISFRSGQSSIFSAENSLFSSTTPATIHEESFGETVFGASTAPLEFREEDKGAYRLYRANQEHVDLSTDLTYQLGSVVRLASSELAGKSAREILSYLEEHGYRCTNMDDMPIIARSLAYHYE